MKHSRSIERRFCTTQTGFSRTTREGAEYFTLSYRVIFAKTAWDHPQHLLAEIPRSVENGWFRSTTVLCVARPIIDYTSQIEKSVFFGAIVIVAVWLGKSLQSERLIFEGTRVSITKFHCCPVNFNIDVSNTMILEVQLRLAYY